MNVVKAIAEQNKFKKSHTNENLISIILISKDKSVILPDIPESEI